MSPKTTPEEILSQFKPLAEEHLNQCVSSRLQFYEENISGFQKQFKKILARLEKLPHDDKLLQSLWAELSDYNSALHEWIAQFPQISRNFSPEETRPDWRQKFDSFKESLPQNTRTRLPETYWNPQPGDPLHVKSWKFQRRRRNQFTRARYAAGNIVRKILRKQALAVPQIYQKFAPPVFCEYYLRIPFEQFLLNEWGKYLQLAFRQIGLLHTVIQELHTRMLFLEEAEQVWIQTDLQKTAPQLESIREYLPKIETLFEEIASFRSAIPERFAQWFVDTEKVFLDQWHFAGTYILSDNKMVKISTKAEERIQRQLEQDRKAWEQNFSAEKEDWVNEHALRRIQLSLGGEYLKAVEEFQDKTSRQIIPSFLTAIEAIRASIQKFKASEGESSSNLKQVIISENQVLQQSLRKKILPAMMDSVLEARLDQVLDRPLETAWRLGKALPEKQTVFRKKDLENIPPKSEVDDIPIGELFTEKLLLILDREIKDYQQNLRQTAENIIRDISEIDQVVEFNLDAALNLLEKRKETGEAFQTVIDGLERARNVVERFIERGNQFRQQSESELFRIVHRFVSDVQELLDNEKLIKLKIQAAQAKAKERIRSYRREAWRFVKFLLPRIWSYLKQGFNYVYGKYSRLRKITGLAPAAEDSQTLLLQYLLEVRQKIASLPYVYQRLFENRPLSDERFFAGRDKELSLLNEDFKNWQQGYFVTTVIIGERGSGKTTVINFAKERVFKQHPLREIDIKKTAWQPEHLLALLQKAFPDCKANTLPEMEEALMQLDEPVVCIVENIQNLFLKTVDGFDLLEQFLLLISRTYRKVYWVLTCTLYSWNYLNKVINISQYFRRVLSLDDLTREEMENVILRRHRVTGYQLFFETPEKIQKNRRFKKLTGEEERQSYLRDVFFEELQGVASGNVFVAMLYWIRAIRKIENNRLTLTPLIELDYSFIYQLPPEELFTIGALMHHETLTAEEHARVFHQSGQQSVLLFNSLINKGIVMEGENGCHIHPFLYRPAIIALKRLNIIH